MSLEAGVSARPDPRDHALLRLSGARQNYGFPRVGSGLLLNEPLARPAGPHRADHWASLAAALGLWIDPARPAARGGRRILIACRGRPARAPVAAARFEHLAAALERAGWQTEIIDDSFTGDRAAAGQARFRRPLHRE